MIALIANQASKKLVHLNLVAEENDRFYVAECLCLVLSHGLADIFIPGCCLPVVFNNFWDFYCVIADDASAKSTITPCNLLVGQNVIYLILFTDTSKTQI